MHSLRVLARASARVLPAAATLAIAASAAPLGNTLVAQPGGVAPMCEIDTNAPRELLVTSLSFQRAAGAADPAARATALKQVMKELTTKSERFRPKNPLGYEMMLGQVLSLWIADPSTPVVTTRGAIGAIDNPTAEINLVEAANAAFAAITDSAPGCASMVQQLRQSEGWLAMTRKALDLSGSDPAEAAKYAQYSIALLPDNNPYPYQVLGIVAQRNGDVDAAVTNWQKAVDASGTDSSYTDIRQSSLFYLGMYTLQRSREFSGDEQKARLERAVASMQTYLNDYGKSADAATVMQGLAEAYVSLGQTDKVPGLYAAMLATPAEYPDYSLTMAGVIASQADKPKDAIVFFETALSKNPNQRDALRNLAASLYADKQYEKMFPSLDRLVALDPNNTDAWTMYAFAAQGLAQGTTAPAERKKWTDELIRYNTLADTLPVKVQVDEFERRADAVVFSVTLEGNSAKPQANTLAVEFLDISGNVVTTASQEVAPIAKGERKSVRLEASGSGISAYRYKPLR